MLRESVVTRLRIKTISLGFTIVELLIVIVVIAILAAVTIVTYSGVTQRADNVRRIEAARQMQTLLRLYVTLYGHSPLIDGSGNPISGSFCLTVDNVCSNYNGDMIGTGSFSPATDNSVLMSELRKVGTPIQRVDAPAVTKGSGTVYHYNGLDFDSYYAPRTYNGKSAPALMMYWLNGEKQKCGLQDVVMNDPAAGGADNVLVTSTTGYTWSVDNFSGDVGITECFVSIPLTN